ncbi:MAG: lipopolysaccharide biosynthesis protein [Sphingobacteriaceae bacterium]|nr:MAG: lipopolysaccharide biosynthesis protein [Sphingobacteriaceae bacterium]
MDIATPKVRTNDKKAVASGIFWNLIQLAVNQVFAFILKLILAKLLFPEQFGLVGMATVFTGFVQVLNDLGVGAALVQRKNEQLRNEHYHTAFWVGVIWSAGLYIIMSAGIGPLAAWFYHEPKLIAIIPVLSLGILFSPVNLVHRAQLIRQMNFKKQAFINNTSSIAAGVIAIILALLGAGVWALVFNTVATVVFAMPMFFKATGWRPAFIMEKKAFKDVFGFGIYTTGSNILNYLYNNIDYLLIGKLLGASALGVYTLAFVLTDTFRNRLMTVVNSVMYPVYGKNQNDIPELKRYYLKSVMFNCILVFPIMVFFIAEGQSFVVEIFGAKWKDTVVPLQILSASVIVHTLVSGNTTLLRGLGRPGMEMKQQVIKAAIFLPTLSVGIYYYGILGAAWAVLLNKIVVVLVAQYTFYFLIPVKLSFIELLSSIKAPIIATALMFVAAYSLNLLGINYIANGCIALALYLVVIWIMMGSEFERLFKSLKKT